MMYIFTNRYVVRKCPPSVWSVIIFFLNPVCDEYADPEQLVQIMQWKRSERSCEFLVAVYL